MLKLTLGRLATLKHECETSAVKGDIYLAESVRGVKNICGMMLTGFLLSFMFQNLVFTDFYQIFY